jgi:hypothetical protein
MKIKFIVGGALSCITLIASAQTVFNGFYGQLSTGYEHITVQDAKLTGTPFGSTGNVSRSNSPSVSGMPLVLGIGYTWSLADRFTLGLGADYSFTNHKRTNSAVFTYPGTGSSTGYDYEFTVSDRLNVYLTPGYAIDEDKLVYAKFGYSNQSLQFNQTNCCSAPSNTDKVSGYVIGLGYKQMISFGVYGFAEINYFNYDNANLSSTYTDDGGGTVSSNPSSNAYNVLLGVGYRF